MAKDSLIKEIMLEVEKLNKSVEELCPELISTSKYPSILEEGDAMNKLIEHRIQLLIEDSKISSNFKKQ